MNNFEVLHTIWLIKWTVLKKHLARAFCNLKTLEFVMPRLNNRPTYTKQFNDCIHWFAFDANTNNIIKQKHFYVYIDAYLYVYIFMFV